jgi:2-C-methyl-D-erythritol 4-phosphate cytidylyltransferase
MKAAAILLAAGSGERMGTGEPKAFLRLSGKTLLERVVATVESCPDVDAILVAAPAGQEERARELARSSKLLAVIGGGRSRQESVRLALEALPEAFDAVICHDVARPLASAKLFSDVLIQLREGGDGIVPIVPLVDSVKRLQPGNRVESVPRDGLHAAQTPQAFRRERLEKAHAVAADSRIVATDDAELIELTGVGLCGGFPGEPANFKITRPEDLRTAEALLADE